MTKIIKNLVLLIALWQSSYAQTKTGHGHVTLLKKNALMVYAGSGINSPGSILKDSTGIQNATNIHLSLYKPFWHNNNLSIGLNIGGEYNIGKALNNNANASTYGFANQLSSTVAVRDTGTKASGYKIEGGPHLNFNLGGKFIISPILTVGYMKTKQQGYVADQTTVLNDASSTTFTFNLLRQSTSSTSGLAITPKVRLAYFFTQNIGIWAEANYSMGATLKTTRSKLVLDPTIPNGQYNQGHLLEGVTITTERSTKYNTTGINGGLVFGFGGKEPLQDKRPCLTCEGTATSVPTGNSTPALPKRVDENNKPDSNGYSLSWRIERKQDDQKNNNCVSIQSPKNGSNQNINQPIKINVKIDERKVQGSPTITIYKISNDKNYWDKKESQYQLLNTNDFMMKAMGFEKEAGETGFVPIIIKAKQRGGQLESIIDKGKLSEGAYKIVANTSCGVSVSNFTAGASCGTNDAVVTTACGPWINGKPTYNVSVVFNNISSSTQSCTSTMSSVTSATGTITNVSGFPANIPINGNSATVTFTYSPATTGTPYDFYFTGIWNDGSSNTSNFHKIDNLPTCICDYCEKNVEFDYDQAPAPTFNTTTNAVHINQALRDMAGKPLVGVKAEIIGFERIVSDECMKCDKNSNQWGNFIGGNSGTTIGSFNSVSDGGITGNTHHSIYFYPSNSYKYDMDIAMPSLSTLGCCCDKITIKIRYTHIFKEANGECKMCSNVFDYEFTHGTCTPTPTDGPYGPWHPGGGHYNATPLDIKVKN